VFTGASAQSALGMREWLKEHRKQLDPEATAVIALDDVAGGETLYAVKEGAVFASRMHPTLIEIAAELDANSYQSRELSDAYLARSAGLPALRVSAPEGDELDADTFKNVCDFTGALLEKIDDEIGPLLGCPPPVVVATAAAAATAVVVAGPVVARPTVR
jgi:hypothetical protein